LEVAPNEESHPLHGNAVMAFFDGRNETLHRLHKPFTCHPMAQQLRNNERSGKNRPWRRWMQNLTIGFTLAAASGKALNEWGSFLLEVLPHFKGVLIGLIPVLK
jgi:hypothetical protein